MNYATVCSGIGAPEMAWKDLWGHPEFTSEIEPFPSTVLKHYYPNVLNHGDMTKYKEWPAHELGLICGGTPCQSFSVAGLRKGMDDPRGNLTLVFLGLIARYNPRWVVWENVPGVFSSGQGTDLRAFLAGLAELGYSCAYRVLNAEYFGVPQRRRRVFVVGHLGADWRPPFAILSEPQSLRGNITPGRKAGKETAGDIAIGIDEECNATIDKYGPLLRGGQGGTRQAIATFGQPVDLTGYQGDRCVAEGDVFSALSAQGGNNGGGPGALCLTDTIVRRLTPRECERLQGFPDDYTLIPWGNGMATDGHRYKALGNSMAVPVVKWIGRRIQMWEELNPKTP